MKDNKKICVVGLGYVGLPLAVEFGKHYETLGYDIDESRIKELKEYEESDIILVPSIFAKKGFENYLPNSNKIHVINLGVNLQNFYPIKSNTKNKDYFDILFIGSLSIQKGLHYLIEAFKKFKHPKKKTSFSWFNFK